MIINTINIFNLGVYKGQHEINIAPKKDKPVILFGALNGAGKTTLLEGIQIALYGKLAKTKGRENKSYEEYLRGLINQDIHHKYGASIELNFTVNINSKPTEITISRSWKEVGKGIKEYCSIVQDGMLDTDASERASEFIEEMIPSEISNLFFFDGEMIDGYSQPEESKFLIQKGIHTLLGINTISNLSKSLVTIERRKANKLSNETEEISTKEEEKQLDKYEQEKDMLLQSLASYNNDLASFQLQYQKNQELLKQQGYELFKQREFLRQELNNQLHHKALLKQKMLDISQDHFPMIMIKDQLDQLRNTLAKSDGHSTGSVTLLEEEFEKIIDDKSLNKVDKKTLSSYLNMRIQNIKASFGSFSYDIDLSQVPSVEEINDEQERITQLLHDNEEIEEQIERIEQKIKAIPDEEKIKPLIETELSIQKDIFQVEGKINLRQKEIDQINRYIEETDKQINTKIERINEIEIANIIDKKIIEKSKKTRQTLEQFKVNLINKHIDSIGKHISECFKSLSRKKTLNLVFKINPQDFAVEVFKKNKDKLEPYISPISWAAGEKQILGISILWALTKVAKMTFPIVIDTPLSRLDNSHRETVIKNYFPHASDQVLVFSTDTEINDDLHNMLKPDVSKEYLIEYSGTTNSSTFNSGYFEKEKEYV